MNKKVFGRKLSRSRPAREALFATLAKALIINGKIVTTRAKAKAVIGSVEKMVSLAKKGDISGRRHVLGELDNDRKVTDMLFQKVAKAFPDRNSGFIRVISLPRRVGDNAQMVRMEWTEKIEYESKKVEAKKEEPKKVVKKVAKKTAKTAKK
ncbi:MAG: 50S ribosomal protein L17 [Candidatus Microgenomates bacterium]|jgi:large subunit ribosomal protein L17